MNHLGLVRRWARRYRGYGLPWEDLVQEGALGLIRAARTFDWSRGVRFATHASYGIREAILRALAAHGWPVRIPYRLREWLDMPEDEALALSPGRRVRLLAALRVARSTRLPTLEDLPGGEGPEGDPALVCRVDLDPLLARFHPRDRRVLVAYFGIDGGPPRTYTDLAREEGLSRQRVYQLVHATLERLRSRFSSGVARDRHLG